MRILVVDGLQHTRENLKAFLALYSGLEVVGEASSGLEAVRLSQDLSPEIVLVDINLPDMSGLDATRRLVASGASPIVILLTLHSEDLDPEAATDAGAQACIAKSAGADVIIEAIRAQETCNRTEADQ
jgi:DNA-binding NarL/FixJ family response regulator